MLSALPCDISTDGKSLIISPVTDSERAKAVKAAYRRVVERHGKALANLVK